MKKKALVKKFHKPAHPILSVIGIAAAIVFFLVILTTSIRTSQQQPDQIQSNITTKLSPGGQIYHSDRLKISIMIPTGFTVEDNPMHLNDMTLHSDNGNIEIGLGSTNATTIDGSFYPDEQPPPTPTSLKIKLNRQHIEINKQDAVVAVETSETYPQLPQFNYKSYYFMPISYKIYSISASKSSIYPILDQVAQSFRYTP